MLAQGEVIIPNGFVVMSRELADHSELRYMNPRVRDLFWYLFRNANHRDNNVCKRGQLIRRYDDIIQALSWRVGYRHEKYTKHQMKDLMKQLRNSQRITTRKTVRGVIITICNYDKYNTLKNYERPHEIPNEPTPEVSNEASQCPTTINKNVNKNKNIYMSGSKKIEPEKKRKRKRKAYFCSDGCKGHGYHVQLFSKKHVALIGLPYDDKQADYVNSARVHKLYGCEMLIDFQKIFWEKYESDEDDRFLGKKRLSFTVFTSLIPEIMVIYDKGRH